MMEKTASCMAIAEKKTQRPNGCVGIFFQLFDWNRRFAKKKLLSKNLLLPAGREQGSKRFEWTEKMPKSKIHLIADDSHESFKNFKMEKSNNNNASKEIKQTNAMRSPGLVARLMGLESMPAVQRERQGKSTLRDKHIGREETTGRSQNIQKTGFADRRSITRFGSEGLHIKSVLSRAKQNNHRPKLDSPGKCPRVLNAKNNASRTSRLIDVAARILEPGLQATSRAKYTLVYSNSLHRTKNEIMLDCMELHSPDIAEGPRYTLVDEQPSVYQNSGSNFMSLSPQCSEKNGAKPFVSYNSREVARARAQNQVLKRHKMPAEARLQSRRAPKSSDDPSLNRSFSDSTILRMPSKAEGSNFEADRKLDNRRNDRALQLRATEKKRRVQRGNGQIRSSGSVGSSTGIEKNASCDIGIGKNTRLKGKARPSIPADKHVSCSGSVSRDECKPTQGSKETRKTCNKFNVEEGDQKIAMEEQLPLKGDALGALLEQTLKELTSQEEETLTRKKPTAIILQELISALTSEQQHVPDDEVKPDTDIAFQTKLKNEESSVLTQSVKHHSLSSVLEASFSNDSCFSSNLGDGPGDRFQSDADIQDSATSFLKFRSGYDSINNLINHVSCVLTSMNETGLGLKATQLDHAKEVILNIELLFRHTTINDSNRTRDILVGPTLLDRLKDVYGTSMEHNNWLRGFNQQPLTRVFLFHSLIECLESKFSRYSNSVFKSWRKRPLSIDLELIVREGIISWTKLAGTAPDEIIEREMSCSLGKWTDFDVETSENGIEIGSNILQGLVEEVVIDLWMCQ